MGFKILFYLTITNNWSRKVSFHCATMLGLEKVTTTAYHPQTNRLVGRYNRTLVPRLRLYVAHNQRNREIFVQLLNYVYNFQPQCPSAVSSFSLTLMWHTPGPVAIDIPTVRRTGSLTATIPRPWGYVLCLNGSRCLPMLPEITPNSASVWKTFWPKNSDVSQILY